MTDPETEREALRLFEALLAVPESERDAWLAAHMSDMPGLRSRIDAMRVADRMASFPTGGAVDTLEEEPPPERIGVYRIVGQIGRGGMGTVYRGERASGDFALSVAIKLIKPGLFSPALVERFQRERQTLASLVHPNIARLYDGGETESGSPYIVMELVDGLPLLEWAETSGASLKDRLRIVRDICAGVGFAHGNLIVHRDLTPSNVLVTTDGVAKLIDFGIARPADAETSVQHDGSGSSLASLSLTPGFAAPERHVSRDVTTAADIYSIGKLLERLIADQTHNAELNAIVARATAFAPEDRYSTVDALSADIAAWNDAMPVAAMGDGWRYRAGKFVRRYRFAIGAGIAAISMLLVALGTTLAANTRAEARFEQVRSLAQYLLFDLNGQLSRVAGNTGARADLAAQSQYYLEVLLKASGGDRPDLTLETAQGLIQLARIQGSPVEPNIGQTARADQNLLRAIDLLGRLDGTRPEIASSIATARALHGQILLNDEMKQDAAALEIAAARKIVDATAFNLEARRTVRRAEIDLADISGDPKQLGVLAGKLEDDVGKWPSAMRSSRAASLDRAFAAYLVAQAESEGGERTDFGYPLFLEAERQFDALAKDSPNDPVVLLLTSIMLNRAFVAASRAPGAEATAERLIFKAEATSDRLIAIDDRDEAIRKRAGSIKEGLSQNLRNLDRFDEAIAMQQSVLALRRANIGPDRNAARVSELGFSQMIMGIIARDAGKRDLACTNWTASVQTIEEINRRGQLSGKTKAFLPGLRLKAKQCAAGAPLDTLFAPIR